MNSTARTILFWVALLLTAVLLYQVVQRTTAGTESQFNFTQFMEEVERGGVRRVSIAEFEVTGELTSGEFFKTYIPMEYPELLSILRERNVEIEGEPTNQSPWLTALLSWAPFLFIIGFWIFFMRQMQSGGNKALSFGKSKARLLTAHQKKITFKDVAGVDEAKEELHEIIDFLKEPQKVPEVGRTDPEGCPAGRPTGYGQNLTRTCNRRRGQRPFLFDKRV